MANTSFRPKPFPFTMLNTFFTLFTFSIIFSNFITYSLAQECTTSSIDGVVLQNLVSDKNVSTAPCGGLCTPDLVGNDCTACAMLFESGDLTGGQIDESDTCIPAADIRGTSGVCCAALDIPIDAQGNTLTVCGYTKVTAQGDLVQPCTLLGKTLSPTKSPVQPTIPPPTSRTPTKSPTKKVQPGDDDDDDDDGAGSLLLTRMNAAAIYAAAVLLVVVLLM